MLQRRHVLKGLCHTSLAAMLPGSADLFAQGVGLEAIRLNEHVLAVRGPNANVLVVETSEGPVLVDGGDAVWSPALLELVAAHTGKQSVRALINTHWHPEQTGSNLVLGGMDAEIIAHDNTRLWLGTRIEQRWSGIDYAPLPEAARPNSCIYDSSEKEIGGSNLQLGYLLHAHTDGDLFVHLPADNILFTGGFLANDGWPLIDWWTGGWSGGFLNAFESVQSFCNEATVIVPASGPLMTFADFKQQREMYLTIIEKVHTAFVKSLGPDETAASKPAAGYQPQWGNADVFVKLAAQSLQGHLRSGVGNWLPRIP